MKKIFIKIKHNIINFLVIIKKIILSEDRSRVMILSYPRSGNHLVRFIIEYISERPTMGCYNNTEDTPINERLPEVLEHVKKSRNFIAYKFHRIPVFNFLFKKRIIIIRDWRDSITSHVKKVDISSNKLIKKESREYIKIIKNIKKNDLIIDYKEMLKNRKKVCLDIYNYLDIKKPARLKFFLDNIDNLYEEATMSPVNKPVSHKNIDYYKNDKILIKVKKIFREEFKKMNKHI